MNVMVALPASQPASAAVERTGATELAESALLSVATGPPHRLQNAEPGGACWPHLLQTIITSWSQSDHFSNWFSLYIKLLGCLYLIVPHVVDVVAKASMTAFTYDLSVVS
jgi:hypothetical protein